MKTKKTNLIILNSLYTLFAIVVLALTIISSSAAISQGSDTGNIILTIMVLVFILITVLGLWLTMIDKTTKAGMILLRIQAVLKYIFTILMCIALMLFIFVIQDCANALFKQNPDEITALERMKVAYIFVIIMVYATSYFIFYNIMLSIVKKEKPNKPLMVIYVIHSLVIAIALVVLGIVNIIKKSGFVSELVSRFAGTNVVVGYVLVIIMLLALIGSLGMSSYILLEKTFKKSKAAIE